MTSSGRSAIPGAEVPRLFNTPFEAGVRTVVILDAFSPSTLSLERLVALDHFVVHTEDLKGPPSLHPPVRTRAAEMLVRRGLVERGISMMMGRGLIVRCASPRGIEYSAGEESAIFTYLLRSDYSCALKHRAEWLRPYGLLSEVDFNNLVLLHLRTWGLESPSSSDASVVQ